MLDTPLACGLSEDLVSPKSLEGDILSEKLIVQVWNFVVRFRELQTKTTDMIQQA